MIDFESLLFNIDIDTSAIPQAGSLLVAEPFLREPYFHHSVILLIDYEPQISAMGVVLNNRTSYTLQEILSPVTASRPIPVYCGGPMSCDRLFFIHSLGDLIPGAREISPGLYIGGDFDAMLRIVNDGYPSEGCLRFFLGYSGWGVEQLDEELKKRVWAVAPSPSPSILLEGEGDKYWHRTVRNLGNQFRGWNFHPRNLHSN